MSARQPPKKASPPTLISSPIRACLGAARRSNAVILGLSCAELMPDQNAIAAAERIGVIDLGSNSLRLVVFERLGAALFPLFNEKVMCGLGRGIASTGRLNSDGVALALVNLRRFVEFARAIAVDHLAVLATAAVRDASDGGAFAAEVERRCRVRV